MGMHWKFSTPLQLPALFMGATNEACLVCPVRCVASVTLTPAGTLSYDLVRGAHFSFASASPEQKLFPDQVSSPRSLRPAAWKTVAEMAWLSCLSIASVVRALFRSEP